MNQQIKKIKAWLTRYGKSFYDKEFGFSDCDMIDSCMYDLSLPKDARKLVGDLVDEYILSYS